MIEKYRGEILKALPPGNPGGSAQSVEEVQRKLGFFYFVCYNSSG